MHAMHFFNDLEDVGHCYESRIPNHCQPLQRSELSEQQG